MAFDIYQKVFDRNGELLEKKSIQYREDLLELFDKSPEAQALLDEGIEPGWATMLLDFGIDYLSVTPPQMTPEKLREILFNIFPRKVSADAEEAPGVIRELQAFWQFLQREFHLENAEACLNVLTDRAVRRLKEEMSNPANFGMAKSLMMMGKERGFDLTSEEGIEEWIKTYNAEMAAGTGRPLPLPGFPAFPPFPGVQDQGPGKVQGASNRRRMARENRRRNRKKK